MTRLTQLGLDGLQLKAIYLRDDAEGVRQYCSLIEAAPDFRTLAEATLEQTEASLLLALDAVAATKARFARSAQ